MQDVKKRVTSISKDSYVSGWDRKFSFYDVLKITAVKLNECLLHEFDNPYKIIHFRIDIFAQKDSTELYCPADTCC